MAANKKISEATELAGADMATGDLIPVVDVSATESKKMTKGGFDAAKIFAHRLFGTDDTYDIGASGATRPRSVYIGTSLVVGDNSGTKGKLTIGAGLSYGLYFSVRGSIGANADGVFTMRNNATTDFNRLQFGGTTSSFPSIKRSTTKLQARLADDSGYCTLDGIINMQGTAPASASATGTAGEIRYDSGYIYVCTATNTWKRVAIATW